MRFPYWNDDSDVCSNVLLSLKPLIYNFQLKELKSFFNIKYNFD